MRPDVLYVVSDDVVRPHQSEIAAFAARQKLASIGGAGYAGAGGLMHYSAHNLTAIESVATFIDRILRGAKPSALPVEGPTKYELVVNMRTAKAMGLTLPSSFMARVDRIIE